MDGLLVVDDEEGVRRAVQKALGKESYEVFTAPNGNEAIRIVKDHPAEIAICISDFKMPGLDGLQTLAAIGSINPEITRIMLTGYATLESAIAAMKASTATNQPTCRTACQVGSILCASA
jgi:DNA-binding NtrC family response regulator